jgi:hypothetical protein
LEFEITAYVNTPLRDGTFSVADVGGGSVEDR